MMRGVLATGDDVDVNVSGLQQDWRPGCDVLREHRIRANVISSSESRHAADAPGRAYNLAITAEANSEVLTSFAPSIWRAKS
jgi:hypothetical protein